MALAMQRSSARPVFGAKKPAPVRVARSRASAVSVRADGSQVQASVNRASLSHRFLSVRASGIGI